MSRKLKRFLTYFFSFGIIFFAINYFIPNMRGDQTFTRMLIKTVITALVYGLIMVKLENRKKK